MSRLYPGSAVSWAGGEIVPSALGTKTTYPITGTVGSSGSGGGSALLRLTTSIGVAATHGSLTTTPANAINRCVVTQYVTDQFLAGTWTINSRLTYMQQEGVDTTFATGGGTPGNANPTLPTLPFASSSWQGTGMPVRIGVAAYQYRPSTGAVIAWLVGSASGPAWGANYITNPFCYFYDPSIGGGGRLTFALGDRLIFEIWVERFGLGPFGTGASVGILHLGNNTNYTQSAVIDWRSAQVANPLQHPAAYIDLSVSTPDGVLPLVGGATPLSYSAATVVADDGEVDVPTVGGTQLTKIFQALKVRSSPTERAAGKFHQFKIYDLPGYFIDADRANFDFNYLGINYTATITTGRYDNIVDLTSALVLAMDTATAGVFGIFTHNQTNDSTRPVTVAITGSGVWYPRWTNGTNAASTALLAGMLGFGVTVAEPVAALTQTGTDTVYYRQSASMEIATGVIQHKPIPRRP